MGDFNSFLNANDKTGGGTPPNHAMDPFRRCVSHCDLLEIPVIGDRFTWEKEGVRERLDWAFCNFDWEISHPNHKAHHQLRFKSYHRVLVIAGNRPGPLIGKQNFKYQAAWCLEEGFNDIVKSAWEGKSWIDGRSEFTQKVSIWNEKVVGNIPRKKREILKRLEGIDKARQKNDRNGLFKLEKILWKEFIKLSSQEELIWYQKSRCQWLKFGDRNSKFFHATTMIRRKKSRVEALQDDQGNWISNQHTLRQMAHDFFKNLYSRDPCVTTVNEWPEDFPHLSSLQLSQLQRGISDSEIKSAIFEMGKFKAPGPDGIQAHFLQTQWHEVGSKVCRLIKDLFENPASIGCINQTNLVLIPKIEHPSRLKDFRPISLCNVCFKILTKVLANRFKGVMNYLIRPNQCSFIRGRQGIDNIIIAQEAIHTMRTKKQADGFVAIKVDMEKAFDRLDWNFIQFTLNSMGLDEGFVNLIMNCVSTATMNVLWNGVPSETFTPTRGVRQGDPLSPYLFILCMERLGQLIHTEVHEGRWKPLKLSANGPPFSHLFFADDLILFSEASQDQMEEIREIMRFFCEVSGHQINLQKSKMFVSRNVHASRAISLSQSLGITLTADLGKYLGVPLLHQRAIKATFAPILRKIHMKLTGWKGRFLSMAGRTVLIKSTLSTIPSYQMQTLLLPKGVLEDIEKINREFFWNQEHGTKKMHLISWNTLKLDKEHGGLGIKDLRSQNIAFIMKLCWGMMVKPNALWVQCLQHKYNWNRENLNSVKAKRNQSRVWKGITDVWDLFLKGLGKRVRNGRNTKAWEDLWTPLDRPLKDYVSNNQADYDINDKVAQFINNTGSWDMQKWEALLPHWITQIIQKIQPPRSIGDDIFYWRKSTDGNFTVSSAYQMASNQSQQTRVQDWHNLWKGDIPERVKFFIWQVFHERLPTNNLRAKRNPNASAECPFECLCEESILHTLRDCESANSVWLSVINPLYVYTFFSGNLQEWLRWNMENKLGSRKFTRWPWNKIFTLLCWLIWKNRCRKAFGESQEHPKELVNKCLFLLMEEEENGRTIHKVFQNQARDQCRWTPPPTSYIRLDVDGSVSRNGMGACGGIIRDDQGAWLMGFQQKLGQAGSTTAELMAIQAGLHLCKTKGYSKVKLYSDSWEAIQLLASNCNPSHPLREEITETRSLIFSNWDLEVRHAYREANKCADYLAKTAHDGNEDVRLIHMPPPFCMNQMEEDLANRISIPG
ncbi:uncharacterized protein LOC114719845 [Neltuma alba]|uniref:uncharacterized protein LOC114719845 n=1 Tax=Neltuma alba TaxID=207710 RepID=UPI0010A44CBE|nr:uncharacterized protein LOC114719845 [Prosopis alba]